MTVDLDVHGGRLAQRVCTVQWETTDRKGRYNPYSHPLRLNAMYKPPDSTMMSKLDHMNPLVLAKPGYGRFCP